MTCKEEEVNNRKQVEDKYHYLDKKDWDENVLEEVNDTTAEDYW